MPQNSADFEVNKKKLSDAIKNNDLDRMRAALEALKKNQSALTQHDFDMLYVAAIDSHNIEFAKLLLQDPVFSENDEAIYNAMYYAEQQSISYYSMFELFFNNVISYDGYNLCKCIEFAAKKASRWPELALALEHPSEYQKIFWAESGMRESLHRGNIFLLKKLAAIPMVADKIFPAHLGLLSQTTFLNKKESSTLGLYSALKYTRIGDMFLVPRENDNHYVLSREMFLPSIRNCYNALQAAPEQEIIPAVQNFDQETAFAILLFLLDREKDPRQQNKYIRGLRSILQTPDVFSDHPQIQYAVAHLAADPNFLLLQSQVPEVKEQYLQPAITAEFNAGTYKESIPFLVFELCETLESDTATDKEKDAAMTALSYVLNLRDAADNRIWEKYPDVIEVLAPYLSRDHSLVEALILEMNRNELAIFMQKLTELHDRSIPGNFINQRIESFIEGHYPLIIKELHAGKPLPDRDFLKFDPVLKWLKELKDRDQSRQGDPKYRMQTMFDKPTGSGRRRRHSI